MTIQNNEQLKRLSIAVVNAWGRLSRDYNFDGISVNEVAQALTYALGEIDRLETFFKASEICRMQAAKLAGNFIEESQNLTAELNRIKAISVEEMACVIRTVSGLPHDRLGNCHEYLEDSKMIAQAVYNLIHGVENDR